MTGRPGRGGGVPTVDKSRMAELDKRHPDFEAGNSEALVHGGNSQRAIAAKAELVHAELVVVAPWLDEALFAPAVSRYLAATAREQLLHQHIVDLSEQKGAGAVPPRVWEQATAAARLAAKLGQDLGIDPIGHARLRAVTGTAEVAQETLEDHRERGRKAIERREQRQALADGNSDDTEAIVVDDEDGS